MPPSAAPTGVLLAAGASVRFGGRKLLAPLADGMPVGVAAGRALRAVLPEVVAVVRPGDDALADLLRREGARVVACERADEGMGASLACGVGASPDAAGWVVHLADMPWVRPSTVRAVADAIAGGASFAAPRHRGERGHPVGFAHAQRDALLALGGDEGARAVLARAGTALVLVDVDDPGALRDVDRPADLGR